MKRVRYSKYTGDLASEMDMEDLLQAMSDYLLDSGFRDPYARFQEFDHNLEDLREALRRVLEAGDFFDKMTQKKLDQLSAEGKLDELIDKLLNRMEQENYISMPSDAREPSRLRNWAARWAMCRARFALR